MKNKKTLYLILSILNTLYILVSAIMLIKNFGGCSIANKIVGPIMLAGFMWLDYYFIKKYKYNEVDIKTAMGNGAKKKSIKVKPIHIGLIMICVAITVFMSNVLNNGDLSDEVANMKGVTKIDGLPDEESIEVNNILKQCGFSDIKSIEHDELLDNANSEGEKGYRVVSDGLDNIILYISDDKKVNIVRWASNDLYKEGAVVSNITDYMITLDEKSNLQYKCQEAIKGVLKTPSKAKFPNITEWAFGKDKDRIVIQSYVDSQNSFGATIRSEFQFILSNSDNSVISFILDGTEYIK